MDGILAAAIDNILLDPIVVAANVNGVEELCPSDMVVCNKGLVRITAVWCPRDRNDPILRALHRVARNSDAMGGPDQNARGTITGVVRGAIGRISVDVVSYVVAYDRA